ncbi:MAG: hypothetical protein JO290_04205 [Sphingomonadaceae bacterium]|nr:hypothetical protein [Sphingomonadaceae bacterium]
MIELTGLDGSALHVAADGIFRLRPPLPSEGGAAHVDYSGGYLLTREPIDALLARLAAAGVRLVAFTTRAGASVYLNRAAVASFRAAPPINAPGTEIVVGSLYQHVVETLAEVQARLAG